MTATEGAMVDVVVPAYNAPGDLRRCVEAVLAHTEPGYRLVVIDDASTDAAVGRYLDELAQRALAHVTVLRNERNLGFTATANRGFGLSRADVVLLNSDAIVGPQWLARLIRCAGSDPSIGTVTPFSNNAEIASFPQFCVNNPVPGDDTALAIDEALAAAAVPTYPDVPTGVGFCLYVRRALLDAIGPFDMAFGAGYGEENDLCLRAVGAGYRNVIADDVYVRHTGGRSFEGRKSDLGERNLRVLLERYPDYMDMVRSYIAADPLAPLRDAAQAQLAARESDARGVLHVIHHHGGGTETHVRALIDASRRRWRHYLAIAVGDRWQLEEHRADGRIVTFEFEREPQEPWGAFIASLCASFHVSLIHLHNISGCRDGLLEGVPQAGVPYGYTVHDLNFACPTITFLEAGRLYCGAQTDARRCTPCLAAQPEFAGIAIQQWRTRHAALIEHASFLVAPSHWAARTFARYFGRQPAVIAHGHPAATAPTTGARSAVMLPADDVPTVAVLGAIGPDKGARRLERLVELARRGTARVRFVLIGYLDVQHGPWQSDDARLTVHGRYAPGDLADLLAHYRVALVLYPSAGPETFSYTLSEAWSAGRPVLVPPIGALAERVQGTGAGFVMTDTEWRDESAILARILSLVGEGRESLLRPASEAARAIAHASLTQMADATIALYASAPVTSAPAVAAQPFSARRVRDALGFRPWPVPPRPFRPPAGRALVEPRGLSAKLARGAVAIRHTALGRALYRLAPRPLVDALKARLHA